MRESTLKNFNGSDRSLKQRLISKFPRLYILIKGNNSGFKNTLINIKGYNAIKKNDLLDTEYYIKNSADVKKSYGDPILHYMYHGFKESRKPNRLFDGDNYLKNHPDIQNSNMNPLVHYVLYEKERILSESNFIDDPLTPVLYLKSDELNLSSDLKIGVFIQGNLKNIQACPYIRLYSPLKQLSLKKGFKIFFYDIDVFARVAVNKIMECKLFDVIIIQRGALDIETSKILLKKCKYNNIKVIYELDDDLFSLDENHVSYAFFKNRIDAMKYLIKNSDLVTVSTNTLAERFRDMNNTSVVQNYLVNELKPMKDIKTAHKTNSIDIGYFGTLTHDDDLLMMRDPLCNIIKKFKEKYGIEVKFHIIGGMNQETEESWFTKVKVPHDATDFVSFMNFIKGNVNCDIMVAPLKNTIFNEAKSELKYIEYTALGVPGVYSDLPPYNSVVKDGFNGLLAKNSAEWELKLEKLILDQNLRIKIVENAQKDIKKSYLLKYRVEEWEDILQNITQ